MSRRTFWIILGIGAALRLLLIWNAGLWYDEDFSLLLARLPFLRMIAATMGDVHPPLWYVLIWPIGQIPNLPPWVIRIPSALLSIGTLALFPRILRTLLVPARVQVIAFVLLAILPMQIHYAQEGRMYALLEFLFVLAIVAILDDRPGLTALAVAGMLYTQNYGLFYTAIVGVAIVLMWIYERRAVGQLPAKHFLEYWCDLTGQVAARWRMQLAAVVIGVLAWLPWLPVMLAQMHYIQSNYWIFDLSAGSIVYEVWKLFFAFSMSHAAGFVGSMLVTFALVLLAVWYLVIRRPAGWVMIAALAFGPIIIATVVSYVIQPIMLFRPLIGVTPFLYLAVAYPLGMITGRRPQLYAAAFILPLLIAGLVGFYHYLPEQKNMDGTGSMAAGIQYIVTHWQPGDLIFHASDMSWINMRPYTDLPAFANPKCIQRYPGAISEATSAALEIPTATLDQLPPHNRIWYVGIVSPLMPACETARTDAIISDNHPFYVLQDNPLILSGIWLLEGK